ncbi:sodium/glucose cotransporter 5 [Ixodes scapularis]|uniref:sodium/glucose cotransporter 5 n=1 Tax=Ixodes scapularis TaxID=6945 RepID=UPI001A9D133A|nr:sodium/glucose cotransporter 5 [Ixodes scapularis]
MSAVNSRNAFGKINLEPWDIVVVVTYFVAVIAVGIWSSWRSSRGSMSGYFLASRSMHWIPVGASLFASNIGSGHFVGLAGSGAASGIGIAGFELNALFVLILLGWFFVPVYVASGVYTMPEYLRKRFGGQRIRIYLSVLALLLSIFTKISADLFAGAIFIKQALGWNLYLSVCALLIVACLFTVAGGLSAVIWTDFVQTVLIVIGAFALMIMSLVEVGGYDQLMKAFATAEPTNASYARYTATNESCSRVPDNYNHLLRSPLDSELPWTGMVFGSVVCAIWYWCSDQVIVQRALSAKNMVHAKAGCVMAGYLKLLPMYLLVIPGMAARVLFPDLVACSSPERCREVCDNENGCTNIAYPLLVVKLMPVGARGMMLSVMLAALMSSLTSIFNSSSTIFTIDIWKKFRKNASEMELLIVGRTFVVVLVGVSIIWIPIIEVFPSSQLFHYIQGVTSYLAPPVCAVYVLAVSWKRINEPGAFWGLMIGLAAGMSRFIWEFSYHVPGCGSPDPDPRPAIISSVHYLHFAVLLFLISVIATVVISLLTPPIDDKKLYRLTYATRKSTAIREDLDRPRIKSVSQVNGVYNGTDNVSYTKSSENLANDIPMTTLRHSSPHESIRPTHKEVSGLKRALFCICGVTSTQQKAEAEAANPLPRLSPAEEAHEAARSLEEHPLWGKVCNVNAVVLLVVASFVLGFYA